MNEVVKEWLLKARADLATARRELRVTTDPNYDAVCFHAQQAVEKTIKAMLIDRNVLPPRTHDLLELQRLLPPVALGRPWTDDDLRFLNRAAVAFRYPGDSAEAGEAEQSVRLAEGIIASLEPRIA